MKSLPSEIHCTPAPNLSFWHSAFISAMCPLELVSSPTALWHRCSQLQSPLEEEEEADPRPRWQLPLPLYVSSENDKSYIASVISSRMPSKGHWRPLPTFMCGNSVLENTGWLIQCIEVPLESGKPQVESAQCFYVKRKHIFLKGGNEHLSNLNTSYRT